MRLHAYFAQGILPGSPGARWAQLPGLKNEEIRAISPTSRDFMDVISALEEQQKSALAIDARKTLESWGRMEIVDASFRGALYVAPLRVMSDVHIVIGERIVTPQALVHLVMKLRISPPKSTTTSEPNGKVDTENRPTTDADEARLDDAFLNSPRDAEDLKSPIPILGSAHSPLWPSVCCCLPLSPFFY
jgi:translocation protein SEC63